MKLCLQLAKHSHMLSSTRNKIQNFKDNGKSELCGEVSKLSSLYVLDSVLQIKWIVPLVWHCAPLQLWHIQLKNHFPINLWIVVMAVSGSLTYGDVSFNFFFIFAQIWPSPSGKNLKVIIIQSSSFTVNFTSSYWKWGLYPHGTTVFFFVTELQPNHLF